LIIISVFDIQIDIFENAKLLIPGTLALSFKSVTLKNFRIGSSSNQANENDYFMI
jgi:hypothetical protein